MYIECINHFIVFQRWGDGICDEFANNKVLDYDGGDCCLPTASKQYWFGHHDYQDYTFNVYNVIENILY